MAGKREKPDEIVSKLPQVEVLLGQGMTIADAVRQIGITQQTYYRWRKHQPGSNRGWMKVQWRFTVNMGVMDIGWSPVC
jgi:putative transposase